MHNLRLNMDTHWGFIGKNQYLGAEQQQQNQNCKGSLVSL